MVLVRVFAAGAENDVRRDRSLQVLKDSLDLVSHEGHEAVRKFLQQHATQAGGSREQLRRPLGLRFPFRDGAEDHPMKCAARVFLGKPEDGSAATDFDIIRMGAQAQNPERPAAIEFQLDHTSTGGAAAIPTVLYT